MEARCACLFRRIEFLDAVIIRGLPVCRDEHCIRRALAAPDSAFLLARQQAARDAALLILRSFEEREDRPDLHCRECGEQAPCKACQFHEWKLSHTCAACAGTRRYLANVIPTLIGTLRFCNNQCQWRFFNDHPGLWPRITGEPERYETAQA